MTQTDPSFSPAQIIPPKQALVRIWHHAVAAVRGDAAVRSHLTKHPVSKPDLILAVGKAAGPMAEAAQSHFGPCPTVVVTKYDHPVALPHGGEILVAAHPVPDQNSLIAGQTLWDRIHHMPADSHVLMLVSGGASALAEWPVAGVSLRAVQQENARLLAEGLEIAEMNRARRKLSRIKAGGLLGAFSGAQITTLALSDVRGDDLAVIGSGIGSAPMDARFSFDWQCVGTNDIARAHAETYARDLGLPVHINAETLYGDVHDVARALGETLRDGAPGCYIFGGEPTVVLPPDPGEGGRNQALALLLAREIRDTAGVFILAAGTDGTDGPTTAAGGIVDAHTWTHDADLALRDADSGRFLRHNDALFSPGPTGTNVMDLLIAIKE